MTALLFNESLYNFWHVHDVFINNIFLTYEKVQTHMQIKKENITRCLKNI